jgi:hypothetical protein
MKNKLKIIIINRSMDPRWFKPYNNMNQEQPKRQECLVYSRVVGWLTPVKNFNKGMKASYGDRKVFKVANAKFDKK